MSKQPGREKSGAEDRGARRRFNRPTILVIVLALLLLLGSAIVAAMKVSVQLERLHDSVEIVDGSMSEEFGPTFLFEAQDASGCLAGYFGTLSDLHPQPPHGTSWMVRGVERAEPEWEEFLAPVAA